MLFDGMDADHREQVACIFELIWGSSGFEDWHDAFAQAVEDECPAIEREMLLEQQTEGTA